MVRRMARDYSKDKRVKRRTVRLGDAKIDSEIRGMLTMYCADVTEAIDAAGKKMVKKLVEKTQATAPIRTGDFVDSITFKEVRRPSGNLYIWGVKSPLHRITHLLVHGHANPDGSRVPGDRFLDDALEEVLPEYERTVLEAIRDAERNS
jgi:hypothetical protein